MCVFIHQVSYVELYDINRLYHIVITINSKHLYRYVEAIVTTQRNNSNNISPAESSDIYTACATTATGCQPTTANTATTVCTAATGGTAKSDGAATGDTTTIYTTAATGCTATTGCTAPTYGTSAPTTDPYDTAATNGGVTTASTATGR